jgi:hypothetical protein
MAENQAREDIAFIRRAIEDGRDYASARGPDMIVWGVAVAAGYLGSYAFQRGWSPLSPQWLWPLCIGLPWIYSLRGVLKRIGAPLGARNPMTAALRMLWLGCGVFLTTLGIAAGWSGDIRQGWFNAVVAGVLGIGFFGTARLVNLPWLRWVAISWWLGELALFALRHRIEAPVLAAVLMLLLQAGPGLVLLTRPAARTGA